MESGVKTMAAKLTIRRCEIKTSDEVKPNYAPFYAGALYPKLAEVFVQHGYALAVHGSMARDFDLIAIPWVECPAEPDVVIDAICGRFAIECYREDTNPVQKPHGRLSYYVIVGFGTCGLDISFMPIKADRQAAQPVTAPRRSQSSRR